MQKINRATPVGPASAYKTYAIAMPSPTHFRPATCAEVQCGPHVYGWISRFDVADPEDAKRATYIRMKSGRRFTVTETGTLVEFLFPAGQECFAEHRVPNGRPELYVVRDGDHRGNPRGTAAVRHNADTWQDDFASHLDRIKTAHDQG
jgi:hypothetical protein